MSDTVRDAILVVCVPITLIFMIITMCVTCYIYDAVKNTQKCITYNNEVYCKEV